MAKPDSKRPKQVAAVSGQVEDQERDISGDSAGNGKAVGRGGANRGQGRKPLDTKATVHISIRVTEAQRDTYRLHDGANLLRDMLDKLQTQ